jgi:hypothetical protein
MNLAEPVPRVGAAARRANVWMLLFLFCLVITVLCLRSLRDAPASAPPDPAPAPAAEEFAAGIRPLPLRS